MLDREMHRYGHYIHEKRGELTAATQSIAARCEQGPSAGHGMRALAILLLLTLASCQAPLRTGEANDGPSGLPHPRGLQDARHLADTFYRRVKTGEIVMHKIGSITLVKRENLEKF